MTVQPFEYPSFVSGEGGQSIPKWSLSVDKTRADRLAAVVNSDKAPGDVRAALAKRGGVSIREKSFNTNPILGARSNIFGICDATEYGYGIYTDPTDYANALLGWLDPAIMTDRRRIDIPILDFRKFFANSGTSGNSIEALICSTGNPGNAARGPIGKCKISYCFGDNPRAYKYCIDAASMQDFQTDCFQQPPLNLFGQTFANDPSQHGRLDEYILMQGMKRLMVEKMLTGSWAAGESTGLLNFVRDFPVRHPELANGCECLLPKQIVLPPCPAATASNCDVQNYYMSVFNAIENRLVEIEQLVAKLGGNATVPSDYWLLVMNWQDAQCIQWAQSCLTFCSQYQYVVQVQPGGISDAQMRASDDFYQRFRAGRYGAGRIIFKSGRSIDIWANPMFDYSPTDNPNGIKRGEIHLFCKGWQGGLNGGNTNAIRPFAQQFSEYLSYMRNRTAVPQRFEPMLNGTGLRVKPMNPCDNECVIFNIDVGFSNAPWMQTLFTGFCPCTDVPPMAEWACNMPPVTPNALCAPANI